MSNIYFYIGTIIGVKGIKGLLKVRIYLFENNIINKLRVVFNEDRTKKWNINYVKVYKKNFLFGFDNINDRNQAEMLIGSKLFINKKQLPKLSNNEYYLSELLGFEIKNTNNLKLGLVNNIQNYGAGNLIEVLQSNEKTYYIPLNKENITKVDLKKKILIAEPIDGIIPKQ